MIELDSRDRLRHILHSIHTRSCTSTALFLIVWLRACYYEGVHRLDPECKTRSRLLTDTFDTPSANKLVHRWCFICKAWVSVLWQYSWSFFFLSHYRGMDGSGGKKGKAKHCTIASNISLTCYTTYAVLSCWAGARSIVTRCDNCATSI